MSRISHIVNRLIVTVMLIWAVATMLFLFFRLMPGDYATLLLAQGMSAEQAEMLREQWGLNDPLYVQYFRFLANMVTLNAGISHAAQAPVWEYVRASLFHSLILAAPAITTAYVLSAVFGTLFGAARDTFLEKSGVIGATIFGTTPNFFLGIVLIGIFASWLNLFPSQGMASLDTYAALGQDPALLDIYTTSDFWHHYALPFLTIVLTGLYRPMMVMRGSVVEVSGQAHSYYHRITGLSKATRFKQTLRHASLPLVTLFPASISTAFSGLVLIEFVFNWPGIGLLLVEAVYARDVPVLQFLFLIIAIVIIVGNFFVDIFYTVIDPRITFGDEEE